MAAAEVQGAQFESWVEGHEEVHKVRDLYINFIRL